MIRYCGSRTWQALAAAGLGIVCAYAPAARSAVPDGRQGEPPAFARMLPDRTLALVVLEHLWAPRDPRARTGFQDLLAEPEVQAFLAPIEAKAREAMSAGGQAVGVDLNDIVAAFGGQIGVAFIGFVYQPEWHDPVPEIALMAEITDRAAFDRLFARAMDALKQNAGVELPLAKVGANVSASLPLDPTSGLALNLSVADKALYVTVAPGGSLIQEMLASRPGGKALAEDADFRTAVARAGEARDFFMYLAVRRAMDHAFALMRQSPSTREREEAGQAEAVLGVLGLDGTRSISISNGIDAPGMRSQVFVHAPAPRKGLFELVSDEPVHADLLGLAPAGSAGLLAFRVNAEKLLPLMRRVLEVGEPRAVEDMDNGLAEVRNQLGIDVESEIMEGLGCEFAVISVPTTIPGPIGDLAGLAAVMRASKPEVARALYGKLLNMARGALAENRVNIAEAEAPGGAKISYLLVPQTDATPAAAMVDRFIVLAPTRATARAVCALVGQGGARLVDDADYATTVRRTGAKPGCLVAYNRKPREEDVRFFLPAIPILALGIDEAVKDRNTPKPLAEILKSINVWKFPSAKTIAKHLLPGAAVGWSDREGVGVTTWGAGGGLGGGAAGVGTAAVIAAIAIPNLIQSRIAAYETAAVGNMRTWLSAQSVFRRSDYYGKGKRVYANPVDGRGFPDLYGLQRGGNRLMLIDRAMSEATSPASPKAGYYYVDITQDAEGKPYDYSFDCGLCAVPADYPRTGRKTFVINVTGTVYEKDNGGKPLTRYPDLANGWMPTGR